MTDRKISELVAVTSVDDADEFVLARSGSSNKITAGNLGLGGTFSGVEVHRTTNLTGLTCNLLQPITYDASDYDTDGYWDPMAPDLVTVPDSGVYLVTCSVDGGDDSGGIDGNAYVSVSYSGAGVVAPEQVAPYDGAEQTFGLIMTNVVKLAAGTTCQPGVNLRISGGTTFFLYKENTHLTVTKLGVPA